MKENIPNFEKEKIVSIEKAIMENFEDIQRLCHKLCIKEKNEFDATIDENNPLTEKGKNYLKERIKEGGALVAKVDNKIVGYLIGSLVQPEDYRIINKLAEAENMYVEETCRSLGIGKKLVNKFIEWSESNGAERVRVIASAQNLKGIEFYEREGFEKYNVTLEKEIKKD